MKTRSQKILGEALDLTRARVEAANEFGTSANVMVARYSGIHESRTRRHLLVKKDGEGFYVRTGKRGVHKRYLADMAGARIVDRNNLVVVFFEIGE